jgi:hypothetical protein
LAAISALLEVQLLVGGVALDLEQLMNKLA